MTKHAGLTAISEAVGTRVTAVRKRQGMSVEQLVQRCAELGAEELTANAIYALESGRKERETGRRRRHITVDELLALALALGVAPVDLIVSSELEDEASWRPVPAMEITAEQGREWIAGTGLLLHPTSYAELVDVIQWMPKTRGNLVAANWQDRIAREGQRVAGQNRAIDAGKRAGAYFPAEGQVQASPDGRGDHDV